MADTASDSILPYSSNFISVDGHRVHYLDEGRGDAVILLHGNPTWCYYYRNLVGTLRDDFRVIAPDHIGCGLSDRPVGRRFRARDRIEHLKTFLDKLDIGRCSLVMHDWGGPIGTAVAVERPERIRTLVYLNTTITETESLPAVIKTAANPLVGKVITKYSRRFLKLMLQLGAVSKLSREVCEGYFYPYKTPKQRAAIWDFVDDIPFDPGHPTYGEMLKIAEKLPLLAEKPVKIIWGLRDPCFHKEMLSKVARHFPQAEILEIADASHLVLEDSPEVVCGEILNFLKRKGKKTGKRKKSRTSLKVPTKHIDSCNIGLSGAVLYDSFLNTVKGAPNRDAVIIPRFAGSDISYTHMTFGALSSLINQYRRGLVDLGLKSDDKVLMLVPPGIDFLGLIYAVISSGAVPVLIDPGIERRYLFECIHDLRPDAFIGSPKAHLLRLIKRSVFESLKFSVVAAGKSLIRGPNLSFLKRYSSAPIDSNHVCETALIAFTSGATGKPKGVIYTQEVVQAQLEIFRNVFGLEAGKRDLPLLPVFSVFNLANGVGSVIPPLNPSKPLSLNPALIVKLITELDIRYSFGSPALWRKIAEYCIRTGITLDPVEKVLMAGAPVPPETVKAVKGVLTNGEVFTPYGATEALPVTLVSGEQLFSQKVCPSVSGEQGVMVGKSVAGVEIKILNRTKQALESMSQASELDPLEIGEVVVRGANISPGYLGNGSADRAEKIKDGDGFWHRMGDTGYLDQEGNLYFCGRKAHVVEVNGSVYYPVPVEAVFNGHFKVRRSALIALDESTPAIVIEPLSEYWPHTKEEEENFTKELLKLGKSSRLTAGIKRVFFNRSFPVDNRHNAKIFRDRLALWAKSRSKEEGMEKEANRRSRR